MAFPFSDTEKRYHTYDYYLKHRYGTKCARIPIDAGFSCPNRQGGQEGCIYCSPRGSGDFCSPAALSPEEQFAREYDRLTEKWGRRLPAIPYFQAYTGTYADVETLKQIYTPALSFRDSQGRHVPIPAMSIATRPDCLPREVLDYLSELNEQTDLCVELGLQSMHDVTLTRIHRGHNLDAFLRGYEALRRRNIAVCVHIINGLPGEDASMMLQTAALIARLQVPFLKIHMLHVTEGTPLAGEFHEGRFPLLSCEEYVDITCRQLCYMPPETVICRLTGDGAAETLLAPLWTKNKRAVLAAIDRKMAANGWMQGCMYAKEQAQKQTQKQTQKEGDRP